MEPKIVDFATGATLEASDAKLRITNDNLLEVAKSRIGTPLAVIGVDKGMLAFVTSTDTHTLALIIREVQNALYISQETIETLSKPKPSL